LRKYEETIGANYPEQLFVTNLSWTAGNYLELMSMRQAQEKLYGLQGKVVPMLNQLSITP
jgi:hypothetical protein